MALLGPHLEGRQCHATMNNAANGFFFNCWFSTLSFVAARHRICMPQAWLADQVGLRGSYKKDTGSGTVTTVLTVVHVCFHSGWRDGGAEAMDASGFLSATSAPQDEAVADRRRRKTGAV
jgi:hypothetical protein